MSNNMNSKKYPTYKDSGIEWIGKIPAEWEVIKLKYIMQNFDGKRIPLSSEQRAEMRGDYPYYGSNGIVDHVNDYLFDGEYILLGEDGAPFFEAYKDVAFFMRGKFWVNNHAHILKAFKGHDQKFLTYALNCVEYRRYITGSTRDKLTQDDMSSIELPIPKDVEQKAIADCLDRKTAQIDELVIKKERMIDFLKEERTAIINQAVTKGLDTKVEMKDSGIEWLGRIPNGWKIKKLKYLSRKIGSGVTPKGGAAVYLTEGIPILRSQNIHFDGLKLDDVAHISEDMHREMITTKVLTGDVLLNITGASIGRCNYWPEKFGEANVNQHVCIVRPNSLINTKYLYFLLSSEMGQRQIEDSQKGISREGLNFEELGKFVIPFPEYDKQIQIIDYVDNAIDRINSLMNKAIQQIEYLKEYRTALISEAVTGKIDLSADRQV